MASVAYFLCDAENIIKEIENRLENGIENAVGNFLCVRLIQKVFRGFITRKHLKLLHHGATCIQKHWRAFSDRIIYRIALKKKFDEMCWIHYCTMATRIQKHWRGYWIRSKVFSYYGLRAWIGFVIQQNKLLKCSVQLCQTRTNEAEMKQREDEAKEWIVYILFKLHHLLRTHQLSGIYSLPNTVDLSEIEKMLKCLRYKDFMIFYNAYMEDIRQSKAKELPPYILQKCKYPAHYEREYYEQKKHNNPLITSESYNNALQTKKKIRINLSDKGIKLHQNKKCIYK